MNINSMTASAAPCEQGAACSDSGSNVLTFDVTAAPGLGVSPPAGAPVAGVPTVGIAPPATGGSMATTGGGTTIGALALVLILVGYSLRRIGRPA